MARSIDTGTDTLTAEVDDHGVAVITMNRPERRNAMTDGMLDGLAIALRDVETAADVRCVVLTGAGGAFCAGGDVKGFAEGGGAGSTAGTSWDEGVHQQRLSHRETAGALFSMPKPTLAAIGGAAAGAGLSLALACDMRIALDSAVMNAESIAILHMGLVFFGGRELVVRILFVSVNVLEIGRRVALVDFHLGWSFRLIYLFGLVSIELVPLSIEKNSINETAK